MTHDEQIAAFVAGSIQAALDSARSRGYPPKLGITRPAGDGSWSVWAEDTEGSKCTVTIVPGPPRSPSAASTDSS
jgi:hypothetical protein